MKTLIPAIAVALVGFAPAPGARPRSDDRTPVPASYVGNWVCQTAMAGYNIRPPHADPSQPLTNSITTPPTVAVRKFSLAADGSYKSAEGAGGYSYDKATNGVTWLDGPHHPAFTKTALSKRDNGAPSMHFVTAGRYYGCFLAKK